MLQCTIGIDIGTTNIKLVTITRDAAVINEFDIPHEIHSPHPGFKEQDPDTILKNVFILLKNALVALPAGCVLRNVSFSAAMHSIMAVDAAGNPLTSLIIWADTRAHEIAQELKDNDTGKLIYQVTGTPIHAMSPLCKIAWLRINQPGLFQKAVKFISAKEYIFYKLFGVYITDYSIASATGLFDSKSLQWHDAALNFAGINKDQLSSPVPVTTSFQGLGNTAGLQLALPRDVQFIIGGNDGCLANLGSLAVGPQDVAITIGTSGAVRRLACNSSSETLNGTFKYVLDETTFVCGGPINNGGIVLQWFLKNFYGDQSVDLVPGDILKEINNVPAGSEGLIFLPYVFGERCPVWDASATGNFVQIQPHHTRTHFLRAVLEGICFAIANVVQLVEPLGKPIQKVLASGGFIKSPEWVQMLADILQKPVSVSNSADASALGAAFVALKADASIQQWSDLKRFSGSELEFFPDPALKSIYQQQLGKYLTLYQKPDTGT